MKTIHIILFTVLLLAAWPAMAEDPVVNINTASAGELAAALNGVGEARARAIVEHREQFGPFSSVDELRYVNGIGASTLERNRPRITVGDEAEDQETAQASR